MTTIKRQNLPLTKLQPQLIQTEIIKEKVEINKQSLIQKVLNGQTEELANIGAEVQTDPEEKQTIKIPNLNNKDFYITLKNPSICTATRHDNEILTDCVQEDVLSKIIFQPTSIPTATNIDSNTPLGNLVSFNEEEKIGTVATKLTEAEAIKQGYVPVHNRSELEEALNANKKICLMNDIDLSGKNWTPILEYTNELNGNGYTIKNMHMDDSNMKDVPRGAGGVAFILHGDNGTVIKNLNFEGVDINLYKGFYAATLIAKAENGCRVDNVNIISGQINTVNVSNVGGLIAHAAYHVEISNIINHANVSSSDEWGNVGGIVGFSYFSGVIGAYNYGNVSNPSKGSLVGGIFGDTASGYIQNSVNHGNIQGGYQAGGITGRSSAGARIQHTVNDGNVTGNYAGGIVGEYTGTFINDAYNFGNIKGETKSGGIVGYIYSNEWGAIENTYSGNVDEIPNLKDKLDNLAEKEIVIYKSSVRLDYSSSEEAGVPTEVARMSFNANNTLQDILDFLKQNGVDAVIENGKIKILSDEYYIDDATTDGILEQLGIGFTEEPVYSAGGHSYGGLEHTKRYEKSAPTLDTPLKDIFGYFYPVTTPTIVFKDGHCAQFHLKKGDENATLGDYLKWLNQWGVSYEYNEEDGTFSITDSIREIDFLKSSSLFTFDTYAYGSGQTSTRFSVNAITNDSTLRSMGADESQDLTIKLRIAGGEGGSDEYVTFTFSPDTTLNEMRHALAAYKAMMGVSSYPPDENSMGYNEITFEFALGVRVDFISEDLAKVLGFDNIEFRESPPVITHFERKNTESKSYFTTSSGIYHNQFTNFIPANFSKSKLNKIKALGQNSQTIPNS